MKKIDVKKSTVYGREISSLKESLDHLKEEGFFSDFKDFSQYKEGVLKSVIMSDDIGYPYTCKGDNGYKYFIPKDKVVFEEEPKKYRPYKDFAEFANSVGIRDSDKVQFIGLRSKHSTSRYDLAYNGYKVGETGTVYIHLGALVFTLYELFTDYEYELNSFEWVPFGVEENEED